MAIIDVLKYDGPTDVLIWKWFLKKVVGSEGANLENLKLRESILRV
jgi:hypothetical protein|tara:strand:- start:234 stop:371 length:138 start_codon:yes stop_codon:yes gene_type:complete